MGDVRRLIEYGRKPGEAAETEPARAAERPLKRVRRAAPKRGPAPRPFEDEDDVPVAEPIGPGDEKPRRR